MNKGFSIIMNGLDLMDAIKIIARRGRMYQALILEDLESGLGKDSREFKLVRKVILDYFNDYVRSIVRLLTEDNNGDSTGDNDVIE